MQMSEEVSPVKFESIRQVDIPKGRDGKHKQIILQLIAAIEKLPDGSALKIPLDELPDSKENIRSALSRATRQRNLDVATSSDDTYLYVWKSRA
jgi:TusA-related sulfurtransferase